MFDLPLHPVAVHFPIALGSLLPALAFLLWWGIKKEWVALKIWSLVPVVALIYMGSAFVAAELGEDDEDKVEKIIKEEIIEEHEEAGERVPFFAGVLLAVSFAGFLKNVYGDKARLVVAGLSLLAVIPLGLAGHSGGELVYKYGAARAHINPADLQEAARATPYQKKDHDD